MPKGSRAHLFLHFAVLVVLLHASNVQNVVAPEQKQKTKTVLRLQRFTPERIIEIFEGL